MFPEGPAGSGIEGNQAIDQSRGFSDRIVDGKHGVTDEMDLGIRAIDESLPENTALGTEVDTLQDPTGEDIGAALQRGTGRREGNPRVVAWERPGAAQRRLERITPGG